MIYRKQTDLPIYRFTDSPNQTDLPIYRFEPISIPKPVRFDSKKTDLTDLSILYRFNGKNRSWLPQNMFYKSFKA